MTGNTGALLATLLVEVPIVGLFYRRPRALVVAFAINVLTNTLLNRVWLGLPWPTFALVSGEALAFAAEAWTYARFVRRGALDRAIAASAAANLASFVLGPFVFAVLR